MMSRDSKHDLKATLTPVLQALSSLGGYFVFTDDEGQQFVLSSKKEFHAHTAAQEEQFTLEREQGAEEEADESDITEYVNRDIALAREQDDLGIELKKPRATVRFEPIKGDISPDLQE